MSLLAHDRRGIAQANGRLGVRKARCDEARDGHGEVASHHEQTAIAIEKLEGRDGRPTGHRQRRLLFEQGRFDRQVPVGCEPIAHDAGYTLTLDGLIGHDVSESSGGNRPHYVSPSPFTCVTC